MTKRRSKNFSHFLLNSSLSPLTKGKIFDIMLRYLKVWCSSQVVRPRSATPLSAGSNPACTSNKKGTFVYQKFLFLFIQTAGLAYHRHTKCGVYHQGRLTALVSHHAPACIYLRLDDIQCSALMICRNKLWMIYKAMP